MTVWSGVLLLVVRYIDPEFWVTDISTVGFFDSGVVIYDVIY